MAYFTDDPKFLAELIEANWTLEDELVIAYRPESYLMQGRIGSIYISQTSFTSSIAETSYNTIRRYGYLDIQLRNRDRERHYIWGEEVYRILYDNRRSPAVREAGYTFMEVTGSRPISNTTAWYQTNFDVKLTTYHKPLLTAGFGGREQCPLPDGTMVYTGPKVPKESIAGCTDEGEEDPCPLPFYDIGGSAPDYEEDPCAGTDEDIGEQVPDYEEDPCRENRGGSCPLS